MDKKIIWVKTTEYGMPQYLGYDADGKMEKSIVHIRF